MDRRHRVLARNLQQQRKFTGDSALYARRVIMNMEFPRRTARQSKTRQKKIELPSLLATISAQQATTPTARIQAKASAIAKASAATAADMDANTFKSGDSSLENSPSFNRLAANLLTGRT
jgi:hypothetical protein